MLKIENLNISFEEELFKNQNIEIKNNCLTLIIGESGCGKTTLLYKLGLIDLNENDCQYYINNEDISLFNHHQISSLKRYDIAFVFQDYILYDHFNIYENLKYYASLSGHDLSKEKAIEYLNQVHLNIDLDRTLFTLSGGQKQRLAIACALTKESSILILDEPTSALDIKNTKLIFQILNELKNDKTIIVTSHNKIANQYCDEIIEIKDSIIRKIKTTDILEKRLDINKKNISLPLKTYIYYMKKQYSFAKKSKMLIFLVNLIILMFCLGTTYLTNHYIENTQSIITKENPGWLYTPSLTQELIEELNPDKYYPYYDISLNLLGENYPVIPYYKEINIKNKIWTRFDLTKDQGVYLSHALFYKNKNIISPTKYIEFFDLRSNKEIKFTYKGILLKGVGTKYSDSKEYIYASHKLIEEQLHPTQMKGYTLFSYSYQDFIDMKNYLEKQNFEVICFEGFQDIENYIQTLTTIKQILIPLIIILSTISYYFTYRAYFNVRKKEFVLLKCIGLTNSQITFLIFFEMLLINLICTGIVSIGMLLFMNLSLLNLILIETLLFISMYLIIKFMVYQLNPITVLRNE